MIFFLQPVFKTSRATAGLGARGAQEGVHSYVQTDCEPEAQQRSAERSSFKEKGRLYASLFHSQP
jgi:hypothetical protein